MISPCAVILTGMTDVNGKPGTLADWLAMTACRHDRSARVASALIDIQYSSMKMLLYKTWLHKTMHNYSGKINLIPLLLSHSMKNSGCT
jgi:hypothetical protein